MIKVDYATSTMPIRRAIEFATLAHRHQVRKGSQIPYIVHPFEVAQILSAAGLEEDLICAGLLHDVVEDTEFSIEDIIERFGDTVGELVSACSENKALSWEKRKAHTIDYLQHEASIEILLISCADKLANLRNTKQDLEKTGEEHWTRFNRGYQDQKWYYTGLYQAFEKISQYEMVQEFQILYRCVFTDDRK